MDKKVATIEVKIPVIVTDENIDDMMCSALEGGITYWCSHVTVLNGYLGEYASEQISHGGELEVVLDESFDQAGTTSYLLDKEKFLKGLKMYLNDRFRDCFYASSKEGKAEIDTGHIDGEAADMIVQYALFDELVFG